jgi:NTP pyrophosphatase (non-canonical NTP hydrolase)
MDLKFTLDDLQKHVDLWITKHGGYWPPLSMLAAIIEEIGELAREINHLEGYKPKKLMSASIDIGEELADTLFALICLANHYEINLNEQMNKTMAKYASRDKTRFL